MTPHPLRIRAVILDWAGTVVDHGSLAPAGVFVELFARHGVTVPVQTVQLYMGTHKREHLRQLCARPELRAAWEEAQGRPLDEATEEALYAEAVPAQLECLPRFATPIEGALDAVAALRARGIRIGSTTGYTRVMLDVLAPVAARLGYVPDCAFAADEVPRGRPAPDLNLAAARALGVEDPAAIIAVGDTVADMQAARAAGVWAVGLSRTGALLGRTAAEVAALSPEERERALAGAARTLREAGAHDVIESLAELPALVERWEAQAPTAAAPDRSAGA